MGNAVDAVKAFVKPVEKLIDLLQYAFGKIYEPRYVKRMADAKAYEAQAVADAMRNSSDMPILYSKGDITIDSTDFEEFTKRTQNRMAYQELIKQKNIENVIGQAYKLLDGEEEVPAEPLDPDWIMRFFNSVEDISNENMQKIWSYLLAGEVKKPHTFTMRTLDVLRNLSQSEADLFSKIVPYVFRCYGDESKTFFDCFLPAASLLSKNRILERYGIPFSLIVDLQDAGLLSSTSSVSTSLYINTGETECIFGNNHTIKITNNSEYNAVIMHPAYLLTTAGKELLPIVLNNDNRAPDAYYDECFENFKNFVQATEANTVPQLSWEIQHKE